MNTEDIYHEAGLWSSLLKKYFDEELTPDERNRLSAWLRSDRKNRELLHRLRNQNLLRERYLRFKKIDPLREFRLLTERYPEIREKRRLYWWNYAAAVIVVGLLVGGGWWLSLQEDESVEVAGRCEAVSRVQAVLTTADGKVVEIVAKVNLDGLPAFQVKDSLDELVYIPDSTVQEPGRYHQLDIPRGGEYKFILADGTKVQLNSESSIRFPEFFAKDCRKIEVSGNVYFEVAKDTERPFIVHAGEYITKVLGTHFMIRAYPDESGATVTLEEGSVEVSLYNSRVVLQPGQQAYHENKRLQIRDVNSETEFAWVRGWFVFEHKPLEQVVKELSRWYDIRFYFENEDLKNYVFTGSVKRDIGVEEILSLIERMNVVKFEKREGHFLVIKNNKAGK